MKKLLLGVLIIGGAFAFYACSQRSGSIDTIVLKSNAVALITADTKMDNAVVTAGYESDIFSLGSGSIAIYSAGLKSADMGGGMYRNMFDHFPKFKLHYRYGFCPDLNVVTTNGGYPKTMTLDYGDSLQLENGHILSGKIIIVISAAPFKSSSTQSVTFVNFCNDSVCISGTSVKTRTKDPEIKFTENGDLTITLADGTTIHRVEVNEKTWMAGTETEFDPSDDMTVTTTGQVIVTDSKGNSYSKIITVPLIKTGECKFISSGIIEYKDSSGKFATVDYGNGTCDNKATRTTQDSTTVISLGRERR